MTRSMVVRPYHSFRKTNNRVDILVKLGTRGTEFFFNTWDNLLKDIMGAIQMYQADLQVIRH